MTLFPSILSDWSLREALGRSWPNKHLLKGIAEDVVFMLCLYKDNVSI